MLFGTIAFDQARLLGITLFSVVGIVELKCFSEIIALIPINWFKLIMTAYQLAQTTATSELGKTIIVTRIEGQYRVVQIKS